jgi:hypothetical protein
MTYSELVAFTKENADGTNDGFELASANDVMALDALEQKRPLRDAGINRDLRVMMPPIESAIMPASEKGS